MRYIISFVVSLSLLAGCGTKSELVRTGAFYNIEPRLVRTQGNTDYFKVYGRGATEQDCRINASVGLLKTLIYKGSREGTDIPPLLNEPQSVAAVHVQEPNVLSALLLRTGLLENSGKPLDRMRQSREKDALYSMSFEIGVDRKLLATEIAKYK